MTTRRLPRRHRWAAMVTLATTLAGGLALTQAAPASAAGAGDSGDAGDSAARVETVQTTSPPIVTTTAKAVAACPAGHELMGVGALVSPFDKAIIESIVPDMATNSVTVNARLVAPTFTGTWNVGAKVICGWNMPTTYLRSSTSAPNTGRRIEATARCKKGDTALSAGFSTSATNGQLVLTKLVPGGGQATAAVEERTAGTTAGTTLTTTAICANMTGYKVTQVKQLPGLFPLLQVLANAAACPALSWVVGGGATVTAKPGDIGRQALAVVRQFQKDELEIEIELPQGNRFKLPPVDVFAAVRAVLTPTKPDTGGLELYAICVAREG